MGQARLAIGQGEAGICQNDRFQFPTANGPSGGSILQVNNLLAHFGG